MGPSEEVGKVAVGIIEALKNQPAVLALIVLNVLFICFVYFGMREQRAEAGLQTRTLLAHIDKGQELLSKCVVPP
jgi:preprotein translocase subunit YajC